MPRWSVPLVLAGSMLLATLGCAPQAPPAAVRSTLGLADRGGGASTAQAFGVVHAGPVGAAPAGAEITLVFSKALRPLGVDDAPAPAVVLDPPLEGRWEWIGNRALRFVPKRALPDATEFSVTVSAGVRSLDGDELESPYAFAFSTPAPKLVHHTPFADQDHVLVGDPIDLMFDQEIDPAVLAEAVSLTAALPVDAASGPPTLRTVRLPFTVDSAPHADKEFRIVPRDRLPAGARVRVAIGAVRPRKGELTAAPVSFSFTTWGPLRVLGAGCTPEGRYEEWESPKYLERGPCSPDGIVLLRMSNDADAELVQSLLEVTPAVDVSVSQSYEEQGVNTYRIGGAFDPKKTYRIRLRKSKGTTVLRDDQGQTLASDFVTEVSFGDRVPDASLQMSGTYAPAAGSFAIPVRTMNVEHAAVDAARLTPDDVMARVAHPESAPIRWGTAVTLSKSEPNLERIDHPKLESLLGGGKLEGPVMVRLSYDVPRAATEPHRSRTHEIQFTDHGVFLRVGQDELHAWVLDRATGAAVSGAEVFVRSTHDPSIPRATTDAAGRASLKLPAPPAEEPTVVEGEPNPRRPTMVVFVRRGTDWSYHVVDQRPGGARSPGILFTDRGLYRPGETVSMKGIVREGTARGLETPVGRKIVGEIRGPENEVVTKFAATTNRFGAFSTAYQVPPDAPLGMYFVRIEGDYDYVATRFTLAEYHPAEFSVEARLSRDELVRGDSLTCVASGQYLYGGPMAGAGVRIGFHRTTDSYHPPGYEDFDFDDAHEWTSAGVGDNQNDVLDRKGTYSASRKLDLPGMAGPESVHCSVAATDLNERALVGAASALVHPGEIYVGFRAPRKLRPKEKFDVEIAAVTPKGVKVGTEVAVSLILLTRTSPGAPYDEAPVASCRVQTSGAGLCAFTVPDGEFGELRGLRLRASATDARGNPVSASDELYIEMPPATPPPPAAPEPPAPPPEPSLSIHKLADLHEVGGQLTFDVTSPFPGPAKLLVSIVREDVITEQIVTLPASGTRIRMPVTDAMIPNAVVELTAIAGARSERTSEEFRVSPEGRRLKVELSPSKEFAAPGEQIDLEVKVTDAAGRPVQGEVTLWGADEGTLMLAMYQLPEPFERLLADRYAWLFSYDTREHPLELGRFRRSKAPSVRMGATSVSGRDPRADFRQSVLFEPSLTTGADGRLRHRVKLPDGLTTYRFFAVVATERDSFGGAEASLQTRTKLMARPSLPSVVRTGDRFGTTVVLSTHDLPATDVDVTIEATGVEVVGGSKRRVHLDAATPGRVAFDLAARRAGPYRIVVRASSTGKVAAEDAFVAAGEVVVPTFVETNAVYGEADRPVAELIGDLSAVRHDIGELSLAMSSSPLVGVEQGLQELLRYPYGCAEQTLSQMLPLVVVEELAAELQVDLDGDANEMIASAMGRLANAQRSDGGFGFWSGSRSSEAWLTAYAIIVLTDAQRKGVAVPPGMLESAGRFSRAQLAQILDGPDRLPGDLDVAAFLIDALAVLDRPVESEAKKVFAQRAELGPSGRAFFLHALAVSGAPATMRAAMVKAVEGSIRASGPVARVVEGTYTSGFGEMPSRLVIDSAAQSGALALRALLAADPKHALASPLVKGLLADRVGGSWRTTHETGWALLALASYRKARPMSAESFDVRVFLGGELVAERELGRGAALQSKVEVPLERLRGRADRDAGPDRVTFDVEPGGRLHYEARLRYARRKLPTEPVDQGFFVERTTIVVAGARGTKPAKDAAGTAVRAGDVVRVDLTIVSSSPRRAVAVEAPLPGGLVALAPELLDDAPDDGAFPQYDGDRLWDRRELRDDRVLFFLDRMPAGVARFSFYARALHPGAYVIPPTSAFEMYAPETRGSTATEHLRVEAPPP